MKFIGLTLPLFLMVGCTSQSNTDYATKEKIIDEKLVEVAGVCAKGATEAVCKLTEVPLYYRQLVNIDRELSYGETPNTINRFIIAMMVDDGFLLPNHVGFKYREGGPLPGDAGLTNGINTIDDNATFIEIFTENMQEWEDIGISLGPISDSEIISPRCTVHKFGAKVAVHHRARLSMTDGLNCSARGHLYYFGLNDLSASEAEKFFKLGTRITDDKIEFLVDKIISALNEIDNSK